MQQEQASRTALVIAASLVLLHQDAKYAKLVSNTAVDLCAHVLEENSPQTRLFSKILQQTWFRPIAKLIERFTIPGIFLHYAVRKKCIRELARPALGNGVAQVVVLGAGFDPLSSELHQEFSAVEFWEIDHPATQRYKVHACSKIGIERVHFIALDLSTAGLHRQALIANGFDPAKRTFWIAEGLLMYFPANVVSCLMKTLSGMSAVGSQFAFTFMEKQQEDSRIRFHSQPRLIDWWLRIRGEPFLWGSTRDDLAEFVQPWHIIRFFDHNDLQAMEPDLSDEAIAQGEVICLAEI